MLKGALSNLVAKYRQQHSFWASHPSIHLLENFLETDEIKLRHDSEEVSFSEFKAYIAKNNLLKTFYIKKYPIHTSAGLFFQFISAENRLLNKSDFLSHLPSELFFYILSFLDTQSVVNLSAVSAYFYLAAKEADLWKKELLALCDPLALTKVMHSKTITNYKNLYFTLTKAGSVLEPWELLCISGEPRAIRYAVENEGLNVNTANGFGENAAHLTAKSGNVSAFQQVLKMGLNPNSTNRKGCNTYLMAAAVGSIPLMKYTIFNLGLNAKSTNLNGSNALLVSAAKGHVGGMAYAVDVLKINRESKNKFGHHALHLTAMCNSLKGMEYAAFTLHLDPMEGNKEGNNALLLAASKGHITAMEYAVDILKIDPFSKNHNDNNAFMIGASVGDLAVMKFCREKLGIDPKLTNKFGRHALHIAVIHAQLDAVQYLRQLSCDLDLGMDANDRDSQGKTGFEYAGDNNLLQNALHLPLQKSALAETEIPASLTVRLKI